ncbi:MAG TPA: carbohydrate ABC transporter permease [Thermomicrobiales bacterium]|nr:carbohydrate ABC transporter permease [Thermomicrobiales bacterium]
MATTTTKNGAGSASRTPLIKTSQDELDRIRSSYQQKSNINLGRAVGRVGFWLLIVMILLYTLFPFYWAIVSSLKTTQEVVRTPPTFWPENLTWENYRTVFENDMFLKSLRNSTIVSGSVVILSLLFGTVAAYAMGRLKFRGRSPVLYLILSMTMFPGVAILGSLFQLMRDFNAFNTLWGLVIVYLTFSLPFTIWVLTNFFRAMPGDLEEAALVDGATPLQALRQILIPMAVPGMVTTGLLAFIEAWSEFLYARSFTLTDRAKTVQVAISEFTGNTQFEQPFAVRMAAAVVVTIPLLIGVLLVQRRIISGLTAGAVKG